MKGTTQVVKGHLEEAAGALVGNDKLRAKGKTDQAVGHVKQAVEKVVEQAKECCAKVVESAKTCSDKRLAEAKECCQEDAKRAADKAAGKCGCK